MPVKFKIPASPAVQVYENDTFLGVDFTTDIGNVDDNKSPDAVNMIRSIPGKVRKRMGHKLVASAIGLEVFGAHYYSYENVWLLHLGSYLYVFHGGSERYWVDAPEPSNTNHVVKTEDDYAVLFGSSEVYNILEHPSFRIYSDMAENKSTSYELNQMLVILDGKKMLYVKRINGTLTCGTMESYSGLTVPIVRISCSPDGAGTDYQAFNLLTPKFEQDYIIDSDHPNTHRLQLYTDRLANDAISLKILNNNGTWTTKNENTDFKVNRSTGVISYGSYHDYPILSIANSSVSAFDTSDPMQSVAIEFSELNIVNQYEVEWEVEWATGVRLSELYVSITVNTAKGTFTEDHHYYGVEPAYIETSTFSRTYSYSGELEHIWEDTYFPVTPIAGTDNIKVFAKYIPTTATTDLINHCRFGILWGINGASDRLFVSGNSDLGNDVDANGNIIGTYRLQNRDWYSDQNDPTYFPDTGYSIVGTETSAIMGYSIVNSYLATFKDDSEPSQTVFIREGNMVNVDAGGEGSETSMPAFRLVNTLQGAGAISSYCFDYFEVEPIFLSKQGIYALTAQDITGDRYAQNRSYFLDKKLLSEHNLNKAVGMTWKDYYVICVNNHFYILDGLQPIHTNKASPYALRQYVSFYFEIGGLREGRISCIWEMFGYLYFGTSNGYIFRFYKNEKDAVSYIDDTEPIVAWWTTPDLAGKIFYKNKTFRYVALTVMPSKDSSIKIKAEKHGVWEEIKYDHVSIKIFSFVDFTFSRKREYNSDTQLYEKYPVFSFLCDDSQKVIPTKIRIKKVDKLRFKFSNEIKNEPMGLNNFALEYTQGGNLK